MNNKLNADNLLAILYETIEGVKNQNDSKASKNEKVSLEQAKQINELAKTAVSVYKVKAEAFKIIAGSNNPSAASQSIEATGLLNK